MRPGDAERVEQALDVVGGLLLRVRLGILGHVGRRIAAGVERQRTVAPREERRLQPPALRIAGELVDEHQRGALARLVVVELHASDRHFRHGNASLVLRLASDRGAPSPATSCGSHYSLGSPRTAGTPAPRRPAARTTLSARLGPRGPQPRDVLRLALLSRLASDGGAPRPAAPSRSPPRSPHRPMCWPGRRCAARIASTVAAATSATSGSPGRSERWGF